MERREFLIQQRIKEQQQQQYDFSETNASNSSRFQGKSLEMMTPASAISDREIQLQLDTHPMIEMISEYRRMNPLRAMFSTISANSIGGRARAWYHTLNSESGRFAVISPNLQNIAKSISFVPLQYQSFDGSPVDDNLLLFEIPLDRDHGSDDQIDEKEEVEQLSDAEEENTPDEEEDQAAIDKEEHIEAEHEEKNNEENVEDSDNVSNDGSGAESFESKSDDIEDTESEEGVTTDEGIAGSDEDTIETEDIKKPDVTESIEGAHREIIQE